VRFRAPLQHMRATRVSLSLFESSSFDFYLAWLFLDETISINMIIGGLIFALGIRITLQIHFVKTPKEPASLDQKK
jgi:drug/metabolite transporter (DMT)-like permease